MTPDSSNPNVFVAAVQWLDGVLLGTLASLIAVIAIGSVGLLLLSGRVDVRRAVQVIIGCFVIFGASTIAKGIVVALGESASSQPIQAASDPPPLYPNAPVHTSAASTPYDPYAGAALPPRR